MDKLQVEDRRASRVSSAARAKIVEYTASDRAPARGLAEGSPVVALPVGSQPLLTAAAAPSAGRGTLFAGALEPRARRGLRCAAGTPRCVPVYRRAQVS